MLDQLHLSARLNFRKRPQGLNFEEFVIGKGLKRSAKVG